MRCPPACAAPVPQARSLSAGFLEGVLPRLRRELPWTRWPRRECGGSPEDSGRPGGSSDWTGLTLIVWVGVCGLRLRGWGLLCKLAPRVPAFSGASVSLPKLPEVQGMICKRLRLGPDSGLEWRRLSRVNVNFENQTFPESLRLLSERSKPPLIPHTRPPTLSLASQPGFKESKKRWEVGGSGGASYSQPSLAKAGSFRSGSLEKVGPRRPLVQLPIFFLAKARISPALPTPAFRG